MFLNIHRSNQLRKQLFESLKNPIVTGLMTNIKSDHLIKTQCVMKKIKIYHSEIKNTAVGISIFHVMAGESSQYTKTKLLTSFSNIRYNKSCELINNFECIYPTDYKYTRKTLPYLECAKLYNNIPLTNAPYVICMEGEEIENPYCIVHNNKAYFGSDPVMLVDYIIYNSPYGHSAVVVYVISLSILCCYFIYNLF